MVKNFSSQISSSQQIIIVYYCNRNFNLFRDFITDPYKGCGEQKL